MKKPHKKGIFDPRHIKKNRKQQGPEEFEDKGKYEDIPHNHLGPVFDTVQIHVPYGGSPAYGEPVSRDHQEEATETYNPQAAGLY
jgi:hypothetical protein